MAAVTNLHSYQISASFFSLSDKFSVTNSENFYAVRGIIKKKKHKNNIENNDRTIMRKGRMSSSFNDDDEHIYDSLSDFNRIHFEAHSMNDIHRAPSNSSTFVRLRSRKSVTSSIDSNENCWQQYWNWYLF